MYIHIHIYIHIHSSILCFGLYSMLEDVPSVISEGNLKVELCFLICIINILELKLNYFSVFFFRLEGYPVFLVLLIFGGLQYPVSVFYQSF